MTLGATAKRNFILQQGLPEPAAASCSLQYSALLFQPRLVLVILTLAIVLQAPLFFFGLATVLWLGAFAPGLNPFDALYNRGFAAKGGAVLTPAPPPRRFAQFMAGSFAIAIGISLLLGAHTLALVLEGIFMIAVVALAFGAFCFGSFIFHILTGRATFAKRTLPWSTRT